MTDYDFYYWQLPFRGQFVRALMAYAGKTQSTQVKNLNPNA